MITERPEPRTETAVITERPERADETVEPTTDVPGPEQPAVEVGPFDTGKMWTFDNPPLDYFEETYSFSPDTAWFTKARMGALRFSSYCSASFVSPNGLVMTNHHCARESITEVSEPGENLLDNGFFARTLEAEREVPELYVDQLIRIEDVTSRVYDVIGEIRDDQRRAEQLEEYTGELEAELTMQAEAAADDTTINVQVVELYNGGRYSAYTFRRYHNVYLVMAPQYAVASFGGDPDNFTYPRYSLDMSFFRVYEPDGTPLEPAYHFSWSEDGAEAGELVFIVGNPGSTSRLNAVAQLLFEREYNLPQQLDILQAREAILEEFVEANPAEADSFDLRNQLFSLRNSIKALTGQLEGLRDESLIARRAAAERQLQQAILASDSLRERYGTVLEGLEQLQRSKEATATQAGAFTAFGSETLESHVLLRALYGYIYDFVRARAPGQAVIYRDDGLEVEDLPPEVEKAFLAARLREIRRYFGPNDVTVRRILQGQTPEQVAERVIANTALIDSAGFAQLLDEGYLASGDPTVPLIEAIAPLYFQLSEQIANLQAREQNLNAQLARARFEIYGTDAPPDASFSLRIADGVVKPYMYNGTLAPAHTTMFGLYDHYYSYAEYWDEWELPENWLTPPEDFERSTPLNLVSTNDITGGNSGSPLLNRDLEVVGLAFDSNMEALPNVYLYTDEAARAISVDSRGIMESLDDIYDMDRLVVELQTGELMLTEEAADAATMD